MEESYPAVILKIKQLLPTLRKSEQSVAEFMIDRPEDVVNMSVGALAESCGVSTATVLRACRRFGFSGYQDLKISFIQTLGNRLSTNGEEVTAEDDMQQVINKVFAATEHTLQFTHNNLRADSLKAAADALWNAKQISIFGLGGSGPVAMDLQHKLMRLGLRVSAYTDPHLQAISAANCTGGDVVFSISHSGSSRNVVNNTRLAKEHGATVISLSNFGSSPLTKLADITLFTTSEETKYRIVAISSRIAELTVLDSIYIYMAIRSENVRSMRVEKAMDELKY